MPVRRGARSRDVQYARLDRTVNTSVLDSSVSCTSTYVRCVFIAAGLSLLSISPSLPSPQSARVDQHALLPRFKGVGLIAPAIKGNPPPAPVVAILRYLVAPLIPRTQIPDALESGAKESRVFSFNVVRVGFDAWFFLLEAVRQQWWHQRPSATPRLCNVCDVLECEENGDGVTITALKLARGR